MSFILQFARGARNPGRQGSRVTSSESTVVSHLFAVCRLGSSRGQGPNPNNRNGTFPIKILTLITGITLPTLELQFLIIEIRFLNLETQRFGARKNPGTSPWRHVTRISNYRTTIPIIEISSSDDELWFPIIEHHISNNRKHN